MVNILPQVKNNMTTSKTVATSSLHYNVVFAGLRRFPWLTWTHVYPLVAPLSLTAFAMRRNLVTAEMK